MDKDLIKTLKVNNSAHLIPILEKIEPKDSKNVALGMQIIFDNWDCEPGGGLIIDIIEYLNNK